MPTEAINDAVQTILSYLMGHLMLIPGMPLVVQYIKNSYQDDPFRVGLEALLVFFTIKYLVSKPVDSRLELTEKEVDALIEEWEPEPLVSEDLLQQVPPDCDPIVSQSGVFVDTASGGHLLNLTSPNYLGLHNTDRVKKLAIETVQTYGVGTCGPAGFYGTLDLHLKLEKELARVLGTESAIIYAQCYAAVSSVIPAFSKRGDIIVADEMVNLAILKGMQISRSRIYFFKHNDMDDLDRVLHQINEEDRQKKRRLTRRFIMVEGLYAKTGEIAKLRSLVALKESFKYRLIVDESTSLGALGPRGLGVGDYFGIPNSDIDILVGNMCGVLGAAGGFCAGSEAVVDHQRLSSQAYCFSASLPALLAKTALENLLELEAKPHLAETLQANVAQFRGSLESLLAGSPFSVLGDVDSPLMYIRFKRALQNAELETKTIDFMIETIRQEGVLVTKPGVIQKEEHLPVPPSIKLVVSCAFTPANLDLALQAISKAVQAAKSKTF